MAAFLFHGFFISLDFIYTLALVYRTNEFTNKPSCSNKLCQSSDVLFSLTNVSSIYCSTVCAQTNLCRSIVYNGELMMCYGCNSIYRNPSSMVPTQGYRYLYDISGGYQMHCNVDSDCYMPATICEATRKVCVCTPGYSFMSATNSCDPDCLTYGNTYESYSFFLLNAPNVLQYTNVSYQDCVSLCTAEASFVCRSFDWGLDNSSCALAKTTALTGSATYGSSSGGSYNQRNCA